MHHARRLTCLMLVGLFAVVLSGCDNSGIVEPPGGVTVPSKPDPFRFAEVAVAGVGIDADIEYVRYALYPHPPTNEHSSETRTSRLGALFHMWPTPITDSASAAGHRDTISLRTSSTATSKDMASTTTTSSRSSFSCVLGDTGHIARDVRVQYEWRSERNEGGNTTSTDRAFTMSVAEAPWTRDTSGTVIITIAIETLVVPPAFISGSASSTSYYYNGKHGDSQTWLRLHGEHGAAIVVTLRQ